jgi:CBS domain-containing protein
MRISDVLRVKGTQVVTVTPDTKVRHLLAVLAEHRIGAVVVSHDGTAVDGIASERDIVRALARRGAAVMSEPVTDIYTAEVHTVTPQTPIEEVMRMMTERRVRHVPVVGDGGLQGIVSIGDVVKIRIDGLHHRVPLTRRRRLQTHAQLRPHLAADRAEGPHLSPSPCPAESVTERSRLCRRRRIVPSRALSSSRSERLCGETCDNPAGR